LHEEVTGDLTEKYDTLRLSKSRVLSRLIIWYEVFHYLRPFAIRKAKITYVNPVHMYKSYFTTAIRNMIKNKLHAFINITGLSVGMAVTILIGLWIVDEVSYERHFDNYSRVGRVIQNVTNNGEVSTWWSLPWPLAEELRKNYGSDFAHIAITTNLFDHLLSIDGKKINRGGIYAEQDFVKIYSIDVIKGSIDAVKDPSAILISSSTAKMYFGDADPIGQTMKLDDQLDVKVGGVYEDMPVTSVFSELHFIASWELFAGIPDGIRTMEDPWRPNAFMISVRLADHATFQGASAKIKDAKLKKVNEALAKKKPELFIHPMSDWHLRSEFKDGKLIGGRIQYVWLFGVVGSFVLLMACINFMNLSTARSEKRAKEVGIRKAIGSMRSQLIGQFFSESILTALFSLALALLIMQLMLPFFNEVSGKNMSMQWSNPMWWGIGISFSVVIGIIAGSYPALHLSAIKSVSAIKGAYKAGKYASIPRKVLVTIQFSVSVVLIIGTAVVFLQIQYAKDRPIGYQSNGLISVPLNTPELHKHFDVIKTELENNGAIASMAESESPVTDQWSSSSRVEWSGKDPELSVDFPFFGVSFDYGKTIKWEITQGRDFSRDFPSDSSAMILNETAARYMNLANPVGETVRWGGQPYQVVGVIKDIVYRSPYEPSVPTIYYMNTEGNFFIMRLNPEASASESLAKIETACKKYRGDNPHSYEFTDEAYARKFGNEQRVGKLATVFAVLAIFISCLGIFGLSSFVAEQRTKEIGIRKVMGASHFDVWRLMSKDFVFLVLLSCLIAMPFAYFTLSSWLESFTYRLGVPWWTFIAASAGTLLITMITVSWHTLNAAGMSPVKSLRSE
jgi:ABC-type antimicrobial peptide transport system permease subunit